MKNSLFLDDLISVGSVIGKWRMECFFSDGCFMWFFYVFMYLCLSVVVDNVVSGILF